MARLSGFKVDGLYQVVGALMAIGREVDDLKSACSSIAETGAQLASRYAPRRSGALAADIRGNRAKSKAVVTAGRVSVPYAGPINYGWAAHGIEANGFMQRADADMRPFALKRLEDEINTQIRKRGL